MRKGLIVCGILTVGVAGFGCHNEHHDEATAPTTQSADAGQQQDNMAVAQSDDNSSADADGQNEQATTNDNTATPPVAETDGAQPESAATPDEPKSDETAGSDEGEQTEVAEIYDGTQFDLDEFVAQAATASIDPFGSTSQAPAQQKSVNTASTGGDPQP